MRSEDNNVVGAAILLGTLGIIAGIIVDFSGPVHGYWIVIVPFLLAAVCVAVIVIITIWCERRDQRLP